MISFKEFSPDGNTPIYLQIVDYVRRGIAFGGIPDGDELPSRRALSVLLGINPNTVQRAFGMLEEEGLIPSSHGVPSQVAAPPGRGEERREGCRASDVMAAAAMLKRSGLSLEQAAALLAAYWEEA